MKTPLNARIRKCAALATAAVPAIPDAITHTIQRALVKFSDSELERLRTLREPEKAAVATFGMARIAAQQNIDDADAALLMNFVTSPTRKRSRRNYYRAKGIVLHDRVLNEERFFHD